MFSFVVIGKNEAKKISTCFASIVNFAEENGFDYELIYVDSQSTDNTLEVLKSWKFVKSFLLQEKCNAAKARNLGASKSVGDILCFVDGDMELIPSFGKKMVKHKKLIHPFLTGYRVDYFYDENGEFIENNGEEIKNQLEDSFEIKTGGLFIVEKVLWESLGGMDNRLKAFEDNDFAYRVYTEFDLKILKVGAVLANHYTVNYTNQKRFKGLVFGDYFKFKGIMYRKYFLKKGILFILLKQDPSFFILCLSIFCSVLFLDPRFLILYIIASLGRLSFIKNQKNNTSHIKRFFFNQLIDFKILIGFLSFFPKNERPVEGKI